MGERSDQKDDDAKDRSNAGAIPQHPLVRNGVPNPDDPTAALRVVGYIGSAGKGRENYYRIYLDLTFRCYYEVLATDVIYAEPPDQSDTEKPTSIFLKACAKLFVVKIVDASILRGSIASSCSLEYGNHCRCVACVNAHGDSCKHAGCAHITHTVCTPPYITHTVCTPPYITHTVCTPPYITHTVCGPPKNAPHKFDEPPNNITHTVCDPP